MTRLLALLALLAMAAAASAPAPAPFSQWAAVIVAGDDHGAHSGKPTRTFDNARRDIARALLARGFSPERLAQFSVAPDAGAKKTDPQAIFDTLKSLAGGARGCLLYVTSHGNGDGVLMGDVVVPPRVLAQMVAAACGERPTAVVVSACFSGTFVPALEGPERLVMTAARRDRSSFGCSESDRYPYFDQCLLESLPSAQDLTALPPRAGACVRRRERLEGMRPPSQPQSWIGPAFRAHEPDFAAPAPGR